MSGASDDMFERLLHDLDLHDRERGHRDVVYGTAEKRFEIRPSEFVRIKPLGRGHNTEHTAAGGSRRMAFVDGGNMVLDWAPDYMIVLNHVYYGLFRGSQKIRAGLRTRQKTTFLSCVVPRAGDGDGTANNAGKLAHEVSPPLGFETKIYPHDYGDGAAGTASGWLPDGDDLFVMPAARYDNDRDTLAAAGSTAPHAAAQTADGIRISSWLAYAARSLAELRLASKITADDLDAGDILVMDGSLQTSFGAESRSADRLYEEAAARGVIVCGLAKTSRLVTESGEPLMSRVSELARDVPFEMWYVPVAEGIYEGGRGFTLAVKLHPNSRHVFRLDILGEQYRDMSDAMRNDILGSLAANSGDLAVLGYPYGLIDADRHAQVRSTEAMMYRRKLASMRAGNPRWQDIARHSDSVIFHDLLNRVSG